MNGEEDILVPHVSEGEGLAGLLGLLVFCVGSGLLHQGALKAAHACACPKARHECLEGLPGWTTRHYGGVC